MLLCELDSHDSRKGLVAGSCKKGNAGLGL